MIYNLPKPHLSFSAISLWLSSKETFRKKYYGEAYKNPTSPEMRFGNYVTEAMERKEEWVAFIPRLEKFEHEMLVDVDGVKILAFVDSVTLKDGKFYEQKTGRTKWTQSKVNRHMQLDLYSLLLQITEGHVQDECTLVWVETKKTQDTREFGGMTLSGPSKIELTGVYDPIPRIVTQKDRDKMRKLIVQVAKEIEEDYKAFKDLY